MRDVTLRSASGTMVTLPYKAIDAVGLEERALFFTKRSLKKDAKLQALITALSMIDLTTLEGADTPERIRQLCLKARFPMPESMVKMMGPGPSVAAVCVYPALVPVAVEALRGSSVAVASVSTAFPSGQVSEPIKLADVVEAVKAGATEIDMVISRNDFLRGRYQDVFDDIARVKEACGSQAHLKVILETGELGSYEKIHRASWLAMWAGADFIKTSTGKIEPGATLPVTLVMLGAIRDFKVATDKRIGMKPAGGIRTAKLALNYLCMVNEILGPEWLTSEYFRFGASKLLTDLLKQIYRQKVGIYCDDELFGAD